MHFYKFNVGDYKSHTSHLDLIEDIAYRRMLDYCYLNEIGLPDSLEEISRLISMRTHCDSIANVLKEFFFLENSTYKNQRVEVELFEFRGKSAKAAESAKFRWKNHANAMRTQSESDANAMLNKKQETRNTKQETDLNTHADACMQSSDCVDSEKSTTDKPDRKIDNIPYQQILELFRSSCPSLSTPMIMTDKRKTAIRAIWKMDERHRDMEFWRWYFQKIEASDFLAGRKNQGDWKADFDFAINKNKLIRIVEGTYDNR